MILKNIVISLIVALFFIGCPSAIARGIPQVIVNAIYAVLCSWARTHIIKEIHKALAPSLADRNALAPIVFIPLIALATTTIKYIVINMPFLCFAHTVTPRLISCGFPSQASATSRVATLKIVGGLSDFCSAFAAAKPKGLTLLTLANIAKHSKTSIDTARNISGLFCWQWDNLWGMIIHSNSPFSTLLTPRDDSSHRRGNLFPAHIIAHLGEKRLAEVTA